MDTFGLVLFAAIGKSSHGGGGGVDDGGGISGLLDYYPLGVLSTALPFVAAWMTTSPFTGVYSPDDKSADDEDVLSNAAYKVGKGWIVAVPLGIALRGVAKGYVPPVPFVIVALISTFAILAGLRILYLVAEDFFVEWRNFN